MKNNWYLDMHLSKRIRNCEINVQKKNTCNKCMYPTSEMWFCCLHFLFMFFFFLLSNIQILETPIVFDEHLTIEIAVDAAYFVRDIREAVPFSHKLINNFVHVGRRKNRPDSNVSTCIISFIAVFPCIAIYFLPSETQSNEMKIHLNLILFLFYLLLQYHRVSCLK